MFDLFRRFMPPRDQGVVHRATFEHRSLGSSHHQRRRIHPTNAHVVDAADEVVVKLTDKREFRAGDRRRQADRRRADKIEAVGC